MVKSRIISLSSSAVGRPEVNFVDIEASPPSRYFEIQSKTDDLPTVRISAIRSAVMAIGQSLGATAARAAAAPWGLIVRGKRVTHPRQVIGAIIQ